MKTRRFSWTNRERARRLRLNFHVYLRMRRSLAGMKEIRRLDLERLLPTLDAAMKVLYPSSIDALDYEACRMFTMTPRDPGPWAR